MPYIEFAFNFENVFQCLHFCNYIKNVVSLLLLRYLRTKFILLDVLLNQFDGNNKFRIFLESPKII